MPRNVESKLDGFVLKENQNTRVIENSNMSDARGYICYSLCRGTEMSGTGISSSSYEITGTFENHACLRLDYCCYDPSTVSKLTCDEVTVRVGPKKIPRILA